MPSKSNRHKNYDTLNLIGYGLSKFNNEFVAEFSFSTKTSFYNYMVDIGVAETVGVVKNRQDLFDGMTEGGKRRGWWQKGDTYKHRKDYIDALFGNLGVKEYAEVTRLSIADAIADTTIIQNVRPIVRSRYKQLQMTGIEAESYFINNYTTESNFASASLEDARLFGDGYDFQITATGIVYLAEVKGIREPHGHIRMTKTEYNRALEYTSQYALAIISNLNEIPTMNIIYDPTNQISFEKQVMTSEQVFYKTLETL